VLHIARQQDSNITMAAWMISSFFFELIVIISYQFCIFLHQAFSKINTIPHNLIALTPQQKLCPSLAWLFYFNYEYFSFPYNTPWPPLHCHIGWLLVYYLFFHHLHFLFELDSFFQAAHCLQQPSSFFHVYFLLMLCLTGWLLVFYKFHNKRSACNGHCNLGWLFFVIKISTLPPIQ